MKMSGCIRSARMGDSGRLSEIEVINYRLSFYPIFRNDSYYFDELQVLTLAQEYHEHPKLIEQTLVYDDGIVKGFIRIDKQEVKKLFVEPAFQNSGIGAALLGFAVAEQGVCHLWALEKNTKAIAFYKSCDFCDSGERKAVDDTHEYLIHLIR